MFKNYIKTAFRNLRRNKMYSLLNVLGLAVSMAACFLIFVVIQFETSFDNFHSQKKNIYRVATTFHTEDGISYSGGIAFPAGEGLRIDFPQLKQVARVYQDNNVQVTMEDEKTGQQKKLTEDHLLYAEPSFFKIFDFGWLAGNPNTSLNDPNTAALTQQVAEKYFGDWKSAIGKTIKHDNKYTYKITGVIKNTPANTDIPLGIVVSYPTLLNTNLKRNMNDWVSTFSESYCFVVLPPELPLNKFNAQLANFAKKHKPAEYAQDSYVAQPLSKMHFDERFNNPGEHIFTYSLITALTCIGIFLLIIACVNFINLATAQAINRSKEVGVRKVLGGIRSQLAIQFLNETAVITIAALLIAICIAIVTLPFLNRLLEVKMTFDFFHQPTLIAFSLIIVLAVIFLSGLYPALILSRFNPVTALKNKVTAKMIGGISLRRALVIFQFAIAHILIIGMLIVVSQMDFFKNASLGFDKSAIINVPLPTDSASHTRMGYVRDLLLKSPDITDVSFSFASPSANGNWSSDFKFDHAAKSTAFSANLKWADEHYFNMYKIPFVAGRPYYQSDTVREFVVNQTLLKKLGVTDPKEAIGKEINFWDGAKVGKIVGVIKDFNALSLREVVSPVVLSTWKDVYRTINIKIRPGKEKAALAYIEKVWNDTFKDYVYDYKFLDETIANFYKQENQLSQLYKLFAGIAIFISCLGLYGLVSFMAAQRTKEMGIRKVLGANAANIVYLLSREFTALIIIAFIIAGPIAYFIMHSWLQNYAYRVPLGASIFILAIVGSVVVAWLTSGYQAIRTALANPIKSLRTE